MLKGKLIEVNGLIRAIMLLALINGSLRSQEMPEQQFGTRLVSIRLVDAGGRNVDISNVNVDGRPANQTLGGYFQIPRVASRIQVQASGHRQINYELAAGSEPIDIVLCTWFDPVASRTTYKVLQRISFDPATPCNKLIVISVHCSLTRKPQFFTLLQDKKLVVSLEHGLYAMYLVDGEKVCKTATVMVPAGDEIKIH